jgi:3-oxoacyl-[acyl-carrier protein] reductase
MDLNLRKQVAVVCGGSQGIGLASAQALAELGAAVILVARDPARLESAKAQLPTAAGQEHHFFAVDFSDWRTVQRVAADLVKTTPTVQILVNNSGGPPPGTALDATPEHYEQAFTNHLLAGQLWVQALAPGMKQQRYGRIVNIISTSVKQPIAGLGVSNTIRGAVASWSKTLSLELGPYNVTVNNVLPGFTATGRLESLIRSKADREGATPDEIAHAMTREVPLGRFAEPREVAAAVAFLASPAASYISGINVPVDGGRTSCL